MYTQRLQFADPNDSPGTGGLRAVIYPTLQLGPHWFAYAAVQTRLTPYFYYDAYDSEHEWYLETIQAFLGYAIRTEKSSIVFKAGRLSSAFGSFPLHYDDVENPLLDQPLSYIQTLTLRHDQIPCGVSDLLAQHYGFVGNACGGVAGYGLGLTPVSLYGLPGVEAEFSGHRLDARVQITSGSPSNPLSLSHTPDYAQWSAGGGYTIRQGFRVGVSGFRGPYLDPSVDSLLPAGNLGPRFCCQRTWPRCAVGARALEHERGMAALLVCLTEPHDVALGRVHVWRGQENPVAAILCGRARGLASLGRRNRLSGNSTSQFAPNMASYELGAGWWLDRHQLLKGSYEWLKIEHLAGNRTNVLGVEFVTTFHALDQAFR